MGKTEPFPDVAGQTGQEDQLTEGLSAVRARLGKSLLDVQRDLRIRASLIAAIEEGNLAAFPNRGVIPGYVRSYARYLDLDPETAYGRFRAETGFSPPGLGQGAKPATHGPVATRRQSGLVPAAPRRRAAMIPVSAIGSVLVLFALVAGIGYGGYTVLRSIQRVQFAPAEELPVAMSEVADIAAPVVSDAPPEPSLADLGRPVAATALAELYRHQEAEVPILMERDGPIAAIDPDVIDPLANRSNAQAETVAAAVAASISAQFGPPAPVAVDSAAKLTVVAERAAWIRVYLENGTVIFERILEKGETYSPPDGVGNPLIWAGNAGSVYVKVGDVLHGPLGQGTRAVRDVVLGPASISETFSVVEQVPEVISQTFETEAARPEPPIAIQ